MLLKYIMKTRRNRNNRNRKQRGGWWLFGNKNVKAASAAAKDVQRAEGAAEDAKDKAQVVNEEIQKQIDDCMAKKRKSCEKDVMGERKGVRGLLGRKTVRAEFDEAPWRGGLEGGGSKKRGYKNKKQQGGKRKRRTNKRKGRGVSQKRRNNKNRRTRKQRR